jgi:DNA processing protein
MSLSRALSAEERRDWLRLVRTPNIGPLTFQKLLARYGTATDALRALPEIAGRIGRGRIELPPISRIEDEIAATEKLGARLVASCEEAFPKLLAALDPPPPMLTLFGRADLARPEAVAIVGARNASAAGRKIARDMAAELGRRGLVIVSGLALGIDGEAHAASLASGTIAVLGGGVDHIYPPQHERLYRDIAERGLIVSESPCGYQARAQDFPRRNRIITGLARGVVVVEAAERSGSLISARVAGEQGREVMAVPGSPLDPRATGTNSLIRQGAVLVRDAGDVLEVLAGLPPLQVAAPSAPDFEHDLPEGPLPSGVFAAVRQALSPHPMPVDEIARAAGLGPARCQAVLMELELAGEVLSYAGGLVARAPG